eukprot:5075935-Alexandrium_andersonii.AAC.1
MILLSPSNAAPLLSSSHALRRRASSVQASVESLRKLWCALILGLPCARRRSLSPTILISAPWSLPQ